MKRIESCVIPEGKFKYGIHKPHYTASNLRSETRLDTLGLDQADSTVNNCRNYPAGDITVENADWIFEIPNPFPFRGRTFINKVWADNSAINPEKISLPKQEEISLSKILEKNAIDKNFLTQLPAPLLLAVATTTTDENDLIQLAQFCCEFVTHDNKLGLRYTLLDNGKLEAAIHDHDLFEAVANNPYLPDDFKTAMVIRPGAQGGSEIVGEWPTEKNSHVYEYLRRNSYIAGGHYAANMAEDAIRYSTADLSETDMEGLRHLYYQRTFTRLATELGVSTPSGSKVLSTEDLESLRLQIVSQLQNSTLCPATLWGWNFGFDYAPTRYRLHASHQQIHQQYALVPDRINALCQGTEDIVGQISGYCCGDLVHETICSYQEQYGRSFYDDFLTAIKENERMDDRDDLGKSLIIWQDENAMLFVPKAQTSQWEIQLMTLPNSEDSVAGNIVECDTHVRNSLDLGILKAQKALAKLGARMVTSIEYSKRINEREELRQPLLYALLPRLPESPGAFSEAQLRFINGHYPEDFATACRRALEIQS